jgi:uncharacterized protein (DUF1015 family)
LAKVIPFKALRPRPDLAQVVSSRSYDTNHNHISRSIMADNEYSYLHVVKPHLNFSDPERIPEKHFPIARRKLEALIEENVLQKDNQPAFYLHQITDNIKHLVYKGIVGLASVDDYLNNHIKKHEHTLTKKEMGLVNHINYVKAVGEPVLLTFEAGEWYDELVDQVTATTPEYDFTSDDGLHHNLWVINEAEAVKGISQHMQEAGDLYIADGHHRIASAARYCLQEREKGLCAPDAPCSYFLAYMIPTDKIKVFEFNRLVKDLNGMTVDEFITQLKTDFDVYEIGPAKLRVKKKNFQFGMYMDGKWYGLDYKHETQTGDILGNLDVSILEDHLLKTVLGIQDSKTDDRLSFIDGTKGISRLQELVDNGEFKVAFSLYPTKIEEVIAVADKGLVMPPKSTWFEPKLRTGLLIHEV